MKNRITTLDDDIMKAVINECRRAAERHGRFNSSHHEGYAVILEELEEAKDESAEFEKLFAQYWRGIKDNSIPAGVLADMHSRAVSAAAEWAQVAAMCGKAGRGRTEVTQR